MRELPINTTTRMELGDLIDYICEARGGLPYTEVESLLPPHIFEDGVILNTEKDGWAVEVVAAMKEKSINAIHIFQDC